MRIIAVDTNVFLKRNPCSLELIEYLLAIEERTQKFCLAVDKSNKMLEEYEKYAASHPTSFWAKAWQMIRSNRRRYIVMSQCDLSVYASEIQTLGCDRPIEPQLLGIGLCNSDIDIVYLGNSSGS